ncbi:hypothetical protein [Taklimakanibacter deserti]|uniref:hypothetical protein n=1 Tax=Taklimakanibacter deserti TaxID=2267839 RepID=UPI0013C5329E
MNDPPFDKIELMLFDAVLEEVSRDLEIADEAGLSRLRARILFLGKIGVRDFDVLYTYATRPQIFKFSMVDPA